MKRFEKIFRGKVSYKKIDKYVDLVRMTIDPDDDMQIEFDIQDDINILKSQYLIECFIKEKTLKRLLDLGTILAQSWHNRL